MYGVNGIAYWIYSSTNLVNWTLDGQPIIRTNGQFKVKIPITIEPKRYFRFGLTY